MWTRVSNESGNQRVPVWQWLTLKYCKQDPFTQNSYKIIIKILKFSVKKNAIENVVCNMSAILMRPQGVPEVLAKHISSFHLTCLFYTWECYCMRQSLTDNDTDSFMTRSGHRRPGTLTAAGGGRDLDETLKIHVWIKHICVMLFKSVNIDRKKDVNLFISFPCIKPFKPCQILTQWIEGNGCHFQMYFLEKKKKIVCILMQIPL